MTRYPCHSSLLAALPAPDPGDLFYDIEGDPFVGPGGIEYLHGIAEIGEAGFEFRALWAHDPAGERRALEELIDTIVEQRRRHPGMHVYHYAPYESSALGKLMGRYGTREEELDGLFRGEVFVDLYRVVRQGLVIGSPSYSLKKLEPLYMAARTGEITDAGSSIVEYERWLQTGDQQILDDIEASNRDDVESTWRLREWLEERRSEAAAVGEVVTRPAEPVATTEDPADDAPPDETDDLIERLLGGRTEPPTEAATDEARARWVMAHLLRWHQREDKPEWWRFFDRVLRCDEDDLLADTEAIAGLEVTGATRSRWPGRSSGPSRACGAWRPVGPHTPRGDALIEIEVDRSWLPGEVSAPTVNTSPRGWPGFAAVSRARRAIRPSAFEGWSQLWTSR